MIASFRGLPGPAQNSAQSEADNALLARIQVIGSEREPLTVDVKTSIEGSPSRKSWAQSLYLRFSRFWVPLHPEIWNGVSAGAGPRP